LHKGIGLNNTKVTNDNGCFDYNTACKKYFRYY